MSNGIGLIVNVMVAILLMLTIGYCMMLNRRLKLLKADEHSLRGTISELVTATEIAERAIGGLKLTVHECDAGLGERLRRAERVIAAIDCSLAAGKDVIERVKKVAQSKATILIEGESGTGKELIAQAIHQSSPRARGPFVAVHCAALSESLLESELFGHEKGSFTGATERRIGRFESADGGTLFLDEIGEISASIQVKLLRFLETKAIDRVGGSKTIELDVRLVTATNVVVDGETPHGLRIRLR